MKDKIYKQIYIGDIRGISVYKCENCHKLIYGKGGYCRICGVRLKEKDNER